MSLISKLRRNGTMDPVLAYTILAMTSVYTQPQAIYPNEPLVTDRGGSSSTRKKKSKIAKASKKRNRR